MCFIKGGNAFSRVDEYEKASQASEQTSKSSPNLDLKKSSKSETSETVKEIQSSFGQDDSEALNLSSRIQMIFIHNLLVSNTQTTLTLFQRSNQLESIVENLQKQLNCLKSQMSNSTKIINSSLSFNPNEDQGDAVISKLFSPKEYRYQLVLTSPFSKVLYKERNFNLDIKLFDAEGHQVLNSNPIPISLCVYTSDDQPHVIQQTKCGQPILKGHSQSELFHGAAFFNKIHIKEVTSYFKNGWVSFVIYAKQPSFKFCSKQSSLEEIIDFQLVKPLIINEVTVRAKKK